MLPTYDPTLTDPTHGVAPTRADRATTPTTEIILPGIGEPSTLEVRQRTLAAPGPGQVRVAVEATGVSFAEQSMRRGKYYDQPRFPFVPGYDLVGTVTRAGADVDPAMLGRRYAALTKTGAWASDVLLDAADLVPVPDGVDPGDAETLVVNGITAWQMLHRAARVRAGQTVLVLGANGGVGTTLLQLARRAGLRVIGAASARHHDAVRALGATPVDSAAPDLPARVRALAPGGVDAVFDHVGGPGLVDSYRLLAPGGTLVAYAVASARDAERMWGPFLAALARTLWWNALPNGHRATFYNIWAGVRDKPAFRARLALDLGRVFDLLAAGAITAQIAARLPLTEAARAMELAESHTVAGKVVLVPGPPVAPPAFSST